MTISVKDRTTRNKDKLGRFTHSKHLNTTVTIRVKNSLMDLYKQVAGDLWRSVLSVTIEQTLESDIANSVNRVFSPPRKPGRPKHSQAPKNLYRKESFKLREDLMTYFQNKYGSGWRGCLAQLTEILIIKYLKNKKIADLDKLI